MAPQGWREGVIGPFLRREGVIAKKTRRDSVIVKKISRDGVIGLKLRRDGVIGTPLEGPLSVTRPKLQGVNTLGILGANPRRAQNVAVSCRLYEHHKKSSAITSH